MTADDRQPGLRTATLDEIAGRALPGAETVTAVIQQTVKRERVADYEQWLKKVVPIASRFPGHRGVNVIHPAAGSLQYTITIRFDSLAHAQDWFASGARRQLVEEVAPFLDADEKVETRSGLEFWFHPPAGQPPAKRYKQFLLTLSVIYPLTMLVPAALHRLLAPVPVLSSYGVEHLIASAAIVALMVYVIMPRYTRLMARWLYR
ncbi:antibiotic biosynthesis monooxygenase [Variovorax sp. Root411]|uniref:antibiotic biosynthesis monooxygenase n=1 Tax=Variovorax sp. Root411 TaxID=1736530 RepID=UPI0006F3790E|nr:antibiotic biosynthesis monooxygenase [Variovorax sp. Root411]KQW62122.1 antibiotic biosynthesis monooxygenase [Variovorax sp. Root411]